ncbi:MAG: DUF6093 family protein [Candidatus Nanopelagicales bacterium]
MSLVAAGRAAHLRLMTDTCAIVTLAPGAFNDTTGQRATTPTTVYTGVCRIKEASVTQAEAGERRNVITDPILVLPATNTTVIPERAVVTVTASGTPALVGQAFAVIGSAIGTTSTARRFRLEARA